jgi:hypothetical protein
MINVTWAITVCNELKEITELVNFLHPKIKQDDEILIQYDENGVTPEVKSYLDIVNTLHQNIKVIGFPLNGDFATFKNNLKNHSNGIFIINVDADEIPNEYLVENIHALLDYNKEVDMFFVPRINTVFGLTEADIKKWGWKVNEKGWVNFPDVQSRIYRRTSSIEWVGKVHERIVGYNTLSILPFEEDYCLYHPKDIERQRKQNEFYETI